MPGALQSRFRIACYLLHAARLPAHDALNAEAGWENVFSVNSETTSISAALRSWRVWFWFARRDIKARYRGSLLGPLWLVLNLAILVGGLAVVYGAVFGQPLQTYVPYLTAGFMAWWFISGCLTESCQAFTASAHLIKNQPLPIGVHVYQVVARHGLLWAHNLLVFALVAVACGLAPGWSLLLLVPGLVLVTMLLASTGLCLALICARYRDIPHLVTSLLQIVMLVTPIMFLKDMLGPRAPLALWNPFFHVVEAIRAPLLGEAPSAFTWAFLLAANLAAGSAAWWLMRRAGHRVAYLV